MFFRTRFRFACGLGAGSATIAADLARQLRGTRAMAHGRSRYGLPAGQSSASEGGAVRNATPVAQPRLAISATALGVSR